MSDTDNQKTSPSLDYNQAVAFLAEKFPESFSVKGAAKPLKIGIFHDIAERLDDDAPLSKTRLRQVLRRYTGAFRYLESCTEGAERVDLDGNPVGTIDAGHAAHAKERLETGKARVAERNKQRKQAANQEQADNKQRSAPRDTANAGKAKPAKARANKARRPARGANNSNARNNNAAVPKESAANMTQLAPAELSGLQIGQQIQVKAGQGVQKGTLKEISKDSVQVELANGLVLTLPPDMLVS